MLQALKKDILTRFNTLTAEGAQLLVSMHQQEAHAHASSSVTYLGEYSVCIAEFHSFRARVLNLIGFLGGDTRLAGFADEIRRYEPKPSQMGRLLGTLQGLADAFQSGFLDSLLHRAEAEVAGDYLGQAERLLGEGQSGQHDHVPAAVLLGAILEQALRTLCGRRNPPIPVLNANGDPKTMNPLIDELKKAGTFNELKAKQLRAWADIRNAAAHGEFPKFGRKDVESMHQGVQTFLSDYL